MKIIHITSFLLFLPGALQAQPASLPKPLDVPQQTQVLKGRNGRHWFKIIMAKGRFRRELHHITGSFPWYKIDGEYELRGFRRLQDGEVFSSGGKNWYGTDGGIPGEELYTFDVTVDGRHWPVPHSLYQKCYEPNFNHQPNGQPLLWARLSRDGKRLTVNMDAGDGAGSYSVYWFLQRNGQDRRKVTNPE